ncbi:MAG TPA: pyridoxamine 5'-phosphate oxidase family protein [Hanamia sp.]|nr:pyridoxamine 5'-phosphate oxidase family protein [Hanamia sp.]
MFKDLNNKQIEKVISENIIGRLGCHADGEMYIVPISYAYDSKYIYFRSFEGLKLSMMRKNPKVCLQIDTIKDLANWESVIVWGSFEELTNEEDRNLALDKLMSRPIPKIAGEMMKLSAEWPFPAADYGQVEGVVYRIRITKKSGRKEVMDMELHRK